MEFGKRVNSLAFDEKNSIWTVRTEQGDECTAYYVSPPPAA
jgi:hypothetical protein